MGILTRLLQADHAGQALMTEQPADVEPVPAPVIGPVIPDIARLVRPSVTRRLALSIPSVRKALHVIAGTISTFEWRAWTEDGVGVSMSDPRVAWINRRPAGRPMSWLLHRSVDDLVWYDRSVWRITDRYVNGDVAQADRLHPDRYQPIPHPLDPDITDRWIVDGRDTPHSQLITLGGTGLGGLQAFGDPLLSLYLDLQNAASRYAKAPHPAAILKNSGADITDTEIDELLARWEEARGVRSYGYLNSVMEYDQIGWNAEELQLTEAREHAALEVARLFGLQAPDLDAKTGDSLTYNTAVESRRNRLEALRPWMTVLSQGVSQHTRELTASLASDAYTRDDPKTRMEIWDLALRNEVLTLDEVRRAEPLAQEH